MFILLLFLLWKVFFYWDNGKQGSRKVGDFQMTVDDDNDGIYILFYDNYYILFFLFIFIVFIKIFFLLLHQNQQQIKII
jgi:hypothetical protein